MRKVGHPDSAAVAFRPSISTYSDRTAEYLCTDPHELRREIRNPSFCRPGMHRDAARVQSTAPVVVLFSVMVIMLPPSVVSFSCRSWFIPATESTIFEFVPLTPIRTIPRRLASSISAVPVSSLGFAHAQLLALPLLRSFRGAL